MDEVSRLKAPGGEGESGGRLVFVRDGNANGLTAHNSHLRYVASPARPQGFERFIPALQTFTLGGFKTAVGFALISTAPAKERQVYNTLSKIREIEELHPLSGSTT